MRILNISQNYFVVGGMDVAMFTLERVLRDNGHDVIPFTAADAQNLATPYAGYFPSAARTESTGLNATLQTLYSRDAQHALARLLDKHQIDIVHLHSYFKRLTPAILPEIRRRKIPMVQTLHEYRAVCPISTLYRNETVCTDCKNANYRNVIRHRCAGGSLVRSVWNYAEMHMSDWLGHKRDVARFITVSTYQRDMLTAMGMDPDKLVTVHHPVEVPTLPQPPIEKSGYVLFFGRLESAKGADLLIEIAARMPMERLVVVGDGSRRDALMQAARDQRLTNVEFRGALYGDALHMAIDQASCAIVPSLWPEAFGLTAVEALARATPVVASAIGGMLDTVRDEVDGFLVPPGDVDMIVDRVRRLTTDPALAQRMGEAGRQQMSGAFSSDVFYRRIMDVYEDTIRTFSSVSSD
ncbi:MAG: glycosyltransferase family 1 protein [Sphingomonas sp.]|nr:MAG: glycosyltransferase family 1 protein [Sphingomonas sp.]